MKPTGVRIIAGDWRGRKLATPAGQDTRPTAARVREALFSMLVSRLGGLSGLYVADFYAGSGALGLEALSRGAAHCLFIERDRTTISALNANIALLHADPRSTVLHGPVSSAPKPPRPVDLAMFDPPYAEIGVGPMIETLADRGWFNASAWLSIETAHDQTITAAGFVTDSTRDIGKARLTLLRAA